MLNHAAPDYAASTLDAYRHRMRHRAAHLVADAVLQLFPDAKFAIGPPTADGFYYDFAVARPFTPEDLARIEALMPDTICADVPFVREELSRDAANGMFADQPFKREIIAPRQRASFGGGGFQVGEVKAAPRRRRGGRRARRVGGGFRPLGECSS